MNNNFGKNFITWLIIILIVSVIANNVVDDYKMQQFPEVAYSEFLSQVDSGNVVSVKGTGSLRYGLQVFGKYKDDTGFSTKHPYDEGLVDRLQKAGVENKITPEETDGFWSSLLLSLLPIMLFLGVWIYFMKQMNGGGGGKAMGFGRSKARLLTQNENKVTFDDVAGVEEAKEELVEVVEFLKAPDKFQKLGGKIPRGALLVGSPGTGKTLLARAVAGEAGVPFFSISGSDFVEMFVGVGASRVRDMFAEGKRNSPCIIFIDEIDAVGRHRGSGMGGGHDEREQTLNQLLVEMDGFEPNESVILMAATNRPDVLDTALLRPGRFDRQIVVPLPDIGGREKILEVHLEKVKTAPDVDAQIIARGTPGFSGAELANLVNEAALLAARADRKVVTMREMETAKDKVMMGLERKSMVMDDQEKKLTAYHEGGHALVAIHCPASDPVHKATIIPRGRALGMVMRLPEKDRLSLSLEKILADMAVGMGGRVAEEIIFGKEKVTTGASSDIQMVTNMARGMVTDWGLSEKLGTVDLSDRSEISQATAKLVDEEVKRFIDEANARATQILTDNIDDLHKLAEALLEHETLSGDEINDLLAGKKLSKNRAVRAGMYVM